MLSAVARTASASTASTSGRPWALARLVAPGARREGLVAVQRTAGGSGGARQRRSMSAAVQAVAAPQVAVNGAPGEWGVLMWCV